MKHEWPYFEILQYISLYGLWSEHRSLQHHQNHPYQSQASKYASLLITQVDLAILFLCGCEQAIFVWM